MTEAVEAAISQAIRYAGEADGAWLNAECYGVDTTVADSGIPCVRAAEYYVQQAQAWALIALVRQGGVANGGGSA